jgi:hypothetical protein
MAARCPTEEGEAFSREVERSYAGLDRLRQVPVSGFGTKRHIPF